MNLPSSDEVFTWPEFKALAERLGVTDKKTINLILDFEKGEPVKITEVYLGEDSNNE